MARINVHQKYLEKMRRHNAFLEGIGYKIGVNWPVNEQEFEEFTEIVLNALPEKEDYPFMLYGNMPEFPPIHEYPVPEFQGDLREKLTKQSQYYQQKRKEFEEQHTQGLQKLLADLGINEAVREVFQVYLTKDQALRIRSSGLVEKVKAELPVVPVPAKF